MGDNLNVVILAATAGPSCPFGWGRDFRRESIVFHSSSSSQRPLSVGDTHPPSIRDWISSMAAGPNIWPSLLMYNRLLNEKEDNPFGSGEQSENSKMSRSPDASLF
jgi:hypothetical protein